MRGEDGNEKRSEHSNFSRFSVSNLSDPVCLLCRPATPPSIYSGRSWFWFFSRMGMEVGSGGEQGWAFLREVTSASKLFVMLSTS